MRALKRHLKVFLCLHFCWRASFAIVIGSVFPAATLLAVPGQWQGVPPSPAGPAEKTIHSDRFLLLDTGGSGGMFGQGDIRKNLLDVFFWDEKLGWTCGDGGIFKTEDGGLSWQRMKPRSKPPARWRHIIMTGPKEIWLLEGFHGQPRAKLWHSEDNGASWTEMLAGQLKGAGDLAHRNKQLWVLAGNFPDYRSDDLGHNWRRERFGGLLSGTIQLSIPSGQKPPLYVLGHFRRQPRLIRSDNGEHWFQVPLPEDLPPPHWKYTLFFSTPRMGWIGLPNGKTLFTEDGGQNWQWRDLPTDQAVSALWFDKQGWGFAAVDNSDWKNLRQTLYETQDGGKNWNAVIGGRADVNALFGLPTGRVWGVGNVPGFAKNDLVAILKSPPGKGEALNRE